MKHVLLLGGTGYLGTLMANSLVREGIIPTVLLHHQQPTYTCIKVRSVADLKGPWDAVLHLAGAPIAGQRWSASRKKELLASRAGLARDVLEHMEQQGHMPRVWVGASAVGYYGDWGEDPTRLHEKSAPKKDFQHELCAAWEQATQPWENKGMRVCHLRLGVVLGPHAPFVRTLRPMARWHLLGRLGTGQQGFSWVDMADVVNMFNKALKEPLSGAYNLCAPEPLSQESFLKLLTQVFGPQPMPMPSWAARMLWGEMSALLVGGQWVLPKRMKQKLKYRFEHPVLTVDRLKQCFDAVGPVR